MKRQVNLLMVRKPLLLVLTCLIVLSFSFIAFAMPTGQGATLPNGLVVDAWMLQSDGVTVANCIGQTFSQYGNKIMQEMINMVWVDPYATSSDNANARFREALAGANPAIGQSAMHTGGYTTYIQGTEFQENCTSPNTAFADKSWYNTNIHHARAWGAVYYNGAWYITVATSTESYIWYDFTHVWTSFNTSRDVFKNALLSSTVNPGAVQLSNLNLGNLIPASNTTLSTGDFDGITVQIQAPKTINMSK